MLRISSRFIAALFALSLVGTAGTLPSPASAHSSGPPNGFAGDPPLYETCVSCHSTYPLNSGLGHLSVTGLPAAYAPGVTYPLILTLTSHGPLRWGFEATMIKTSDQSRGGVLDPVDTTYVQVSRGAGMERDYIKQTLVGTFAGQHDGASWQILWTAPEAGSGTTHFYLAGNAANDDGRDTNDYIYAIDTAVMESPDARVASRTDRGAIEFTSYPNPMGREGTIHFRLPVGADVCLTVTEITGRIVRTLTSQSWSAGGDEWFRWDSRDNAGHLVPAGIYEYSLQAGSRHWSRLVTVLR